MSYTGPHCCGCKHDGVMRCNNPLLSKLIRELEKWPGVDLHRDFRGSDMAAECPGYTPRSGKEEKGE